MHIHVRRLHSFEPMEYVAPIVTIPTIKNYLTGKILPKKNKYKVGKYKFGRTKK